MTSFLLLAAGCQGIAPKKQEQHLVLQSYGEIYAAVDSSRITFAYPSGARQEICLDEPSSITNEGLNEMLAAGAKVVSQVPEVTKKLYRKNPNKLVFSDYMYVECNYIPYILEK